ncbi:protein phosphatase 1 regulatory subunit 42, partial [bacterium]|nr:protein phosphatase 1 regulatory subunit 42 [bacterium]
RLRALPSAVWAMRALEVLDASDNALTPADVPFDDLMDETKDVAPNLKVLNLRGNVAVIDGLGGAVERGRGRHGASRREARVVVKQAVSV